MSGSGKKTQRVTIQAETGGQDTYGQAGGTWSDLATVWAEVITSGGREFYAAQKTNAETSAVFCIWYRSGLNTTRRIKYGRRIYNIISVVDPEESHIELLISAKEVI